MSHNSLFVQLSKNFRWERKPSPRPFLSHPLATGQAYALASRSSDQGQSGWICARRPRVASHLTSFDFRRYVVTAKDPATEDKVRLKYPYVASELLSLELEVIYGSILRNEELCKSLFGFLRCYCRPYHKPHFALPSLLNVLQLPKRQRLAPLWLLSEGLLPA